MRIKLWGTRGSIPVPGSSTVEFGGNTLCVELRYGEDDLIIIDAGTGIRLLANALLKEDLPKGPIKAHLFISHTHWDHIMGFPFFVPIFIPKTELTIYGPSTYEEDSLEKSIRGQLQYHYFPVKYDELAAEMKFISLKESRVEIDGMVVKTKYLNHPVSCLGYRFEYAGESICTLFDHEPFRNLFPTDPDDPNFDPLVAEEGEAVAREENQRIESFYKGVDLLIHDCQYTQEEYLSSKLGWGHSSFAYVVRAAQKQDVKRLLLIHHDPMRTDEELENLESYCQSLLHKDSRMQVHIAREKEEYTLGGGDHTQK